MRYCTFITFFSDLSLVSLILLLSTREITRRSCKNLTLWCTFVDNKSGPLTIRWPNHSNFRKCKGLVSCDSKIDPWQVTHGQVARRPSASFPTSVETWSQITVDSYILLKSTEFRLIDYMYRCQMKAKTSNQYDTVIRCRSIISRAEVALLDSKLSVQSRMMELFCFSVNEIKKKIPIESISWWFYWWLLWNQAKKKDSILLYSRCCLLFRAAGRHRRILAIIQLKSIPLKMFRFADARQHLSACECDESKEIAYYRTGI